MGHTPPPRSAPLILLPSAGYGLRVGGPEAKELLPLRSGRPLIEQPLLLAKKMGCQALVITRREKVSLINFISELDPSNKFIQIQIIEPSSDWPHTLIQSEPHWRTRNIVVLPDTEFSPLSMIGDLADDLENVSVAWAEHEVDDPKTWGMIRSLSEDQIEVVEKPVDRSHSGWAWGLFGFRREWGLELLNAQARSTLTHEPITVGAKHKRRRLTFFSDLTRAPNPGPSKSQS